MNTDPASLQNLRDIVVPPPVSWWPPAMGWWVVLAAVVLATGVFAFRALRTWRANAYRRAALRELDRAVGVKDIAVVLKRTALAAYPREEVASLSGRGWCQWLELTSGVALSIPVRQCLTRGVFAPGYGPEASHLRAFAANWIRRHRQCASSGTGPGRVPGGTMRLRDEERGGDSSC